MKKFLLVTLLIAGNYNIRSAQVAADLSGPDLSIESETEQQFLPHAFFLAGEEGKTYPAVSYFDTITVGGPAGNAGIRRDRLVFPEETVSKEIRGIEHGAFYYVFVLDRDENRLLVFKMNEEGIYERRPNGDKYSSIQFDQVPDSFFPVAFNKGLA